MSQLLPAGVLLVNNIETVLSFVSQIFDGTKVENITKPFTYSTVVVSDSCKLLLINKKSCNSQQLTYLLTLATHHISISTSKSVDEIQKHSIQAGGRVLECKDSSYCLFEGPEGITFFVTNKNSNGNPKINFHDVIISTLSNSSVNSSISSSVEMSGAAATTSKHKKIPLLPSVARTIPTLEAQLLSGKQYVPIIPNSLEPTPFDMGVFKGHAMLVVRTAPIDPKFAPFFEGKRLVCYCFALSLLHIYIYKE